MTTPSRYQKAHDMAAAFGEFMATTMAMVNYIEKMEARVTVDDMSDEMKEHIEGIAKHVEAGIKQALTPYVQRLRMIEKIIQSSVPKGPGKIVTPDDPEFEIPS